MESYDVVAGKIANDNTNATIAAYMNGLYGQLDTEQADNICISLLLPERLQDQFCFRSINSIQKLEYLKTEKVCFGLAMDKINNEKITAAMDLTAQLAISQIADELHKSKDKVLISFMESNTCRMLYNDSNKLWWDGPAAVANEYITEINKK